MSAILVYMTAENREEDERLGAMLVEERLAACVNIIEGMRSLFWWEDKLDQAEETILLAKTKESLLGELTEAVVSTHSYDCPCVVALPILGGNPDFLDWIHDETR